MDKLNRLIRIPALAAVLMFAAVSMAQTSATDSMLLIVESQRGEQKVNTLTNISRQYFIAQDTLAIKYARQAVRLSDSLGFKEGAGKAMLFLGLAWADIIPDTALHYYLKSSEILSALNHSWAHYGYKNASDIYINRGWYPEALDCVLKVFDINKKTGDTLQMLESLSTLGYLNSSIENYDQAFFWQRKALETMGNIEDHTRLGIILGRIGIIHDETGSYDSALYYNDLAVECFRKAGQDVYQAQWMSNIANTQIKLNNFAAAEILLLEAMHLNNLDDRKPNMFNNLAKVYTETGRYTLAGKAIDSAFYFAERFQQKDLQSEAWFRKYELYKAQGKISDALKAYIRYSTLNDSILNEKKTEQIAQMLVRYETEAKEKALLLEKAERTRIEKEKIQAQLTTNRVQMWVRGISLFATLLIIGILMLLLYTKRKAQSEKKLAIIQEQKKGLVALINAQEEERKRVAKDLHDGVGQQISAVSLNFQVLARKLAKQNPEITDELEKIKRMILDTSHEIREVSHQMMPRALTQFGLVDALEDMIEANFRNSEIECRFIPQNMDERLPQEIEIGLYRIAQELINNVLKHSKASNVEIQLSRTSDHCVLMVSDDGTGTDSFHSEGIGLDNINSRVNALKGQFRIESNPGSGTSATVKIML